MLFGVGKKSDVPEVGAALREALETIELQQRAIGAQNRALACMVHRAGGRVEIPAKELDGLKVSFGMARAHDIETGEVTVVMVTGDPDTEPGIMPGAVPVATPPEGARA